ncbi:MAG: Phosphoglucomutase, partial [Streblomastix strix]
GDNPKYKDNIPVLGAACDGDGDRNMILGAHTFVNPADSLAIIAENAGDCVPYFIDPVTKKVHIKGVARSSPTAGALDIVAHKKGLHCFETPTGWKFFGNLMDADQLSICGEESFGTGCDVIREKDGLWSVLTWMSIIAHKTNLLAAKNISEGKIKKGEEQSSPLVTVSDIVHEYWHRNGRFFIQRHDYDVADKNVGHDFYEGLKPKIVGKTTEEIEKAYPSCGIKSADVFDYTDPIDHSISLNQGVRIYFLDGSRVVVRLSGTAGSGATIRVYFEKYSKDETKFDSD